MAMLKIARLEKLAQSFVSNCGDVVAAYKEAQPEASEGKTNYKIKKMFDTLVKNDAAFWRRVAELQKPVEERVAMNAIAVMNEWTQIAQAEAADIVQIKRHWYDCGACGCGTPPEDPSDPKCVDCGSPMRSYQYVNITATDDMTPAQRKLFAGAVQTKEGIKVMLRDQDGALANIAKALGMFTEQLRILNPDNVELPPLPDDPHEAARVYAEWVKVK